MTFIVIQPPVDPQQLPSYLDGMFRNVQEEFNAILSRQAKSDILDLSGAAAKSIVYVPEQPIIITRVVAVYTEATSADAGVTVTLESADGATKYATFTSDTGQTLWAVIEKDRAIALIDASQPVVATSTGGKTGTGEVQLIMEYAATAEA